MKLQANMGDLMRIRFWRSKEKPLELNYYIILKESCRGPTCKLYKTKFKMKGGCLALDYLLPKLVTFFEDVRQDVYGLFSGRKRSADVR